MEISSVGVILLDFSARSRSCFHPLSPFLVSAVKGEVLQQFGNANRGVQDQIKYLRALLLYVTVCPFPFLCCSGDEGKQGKQQKKTRCDIKLGDGVLGVVFVVTAAPEEQRLN